MATRGWVFVLFVIANEVVCPCANSSQSGSPDKHDCMDGLRHADTDGLLIYKDVLTGHWSPPNRAAMECLQLQMDRQKNSISKLGALLDSIDVKDCGEIYRNTKGRMVSGIYTIYPRASDGEDKSAPLRVFCRVKAGRAWTVIQRRQDGSVDFYNRTWEDYSRGFGNLTGEFWLGNDNIHLLTNQGRYKLYMDFETFDGKLYYSDYACFHVENEQARYKLHVGPHNGTAGQHLWYQRGGVFQQKRCDARLSPSSSCYLHKPGGFWMRRCDTLNPNGFYWKKAEDCPKYSRNKRPGVLGSKFIEMRISESDNTTSSKQKYDEYCK